MNMEYMSIKPGSILLQRDYNWIVTLVQDQKEES